MTWQPRSEAAIGAGMRRECVEKARSVRLDGWAGRWRQWCWRSRFVVAGAVLTACGSDDNRAASTTAISGVPAGTVPCGGKNALTAEGSTAQQNAIALFNQVWGQFCPGKNVSYNPTGSGAGREQFIAGHVDFAGSDSPLIADQIGPAAKRCNGNPAWDLPLVFGPVALVYNLTGVQSWSSTATRWPRSSAAGSRTGMTRYSRHSIPALRCPTPRSRRSTGRTRREPPTTCRSI